MNFLYAGLMLFTLGGPLILSFDKKVHYYTHFKSVLKAILVVAFVFIPWDIWKTSVGVWGFNDDYLLGMRFYGLPIEEIAFFICVPYAILFIDACLLNYFPKFFERIERLNPYPVILIYAVLSSCFFLAGLDKFYSFSMAILGLLNALLVTLFWRKYVWRFLIVFLVVCIPFILVNGILTGSLTESPIVWYSDTHFSTLRFFSIPVEDFFYDILLLTASYVGYYWGRNKDKIYAS